MNDSAEKSKYIPMAVKKRKLKKVVKIILVLLGIILFFAIITGVQLHKIQRLEQQQDQTTHEIKRLKKEVKQKEREKFLAQNPQEAYAVKVKQTLKKQNLYDWLILQTDERYRDLPYGWGPVPTLEVNGCVIDALAIVDSGIQNREVSPEEILKWSKNTYFTDEGTSWSIFKDFADKSGYKYKDLGDKVEDTVPYLEKGTPVIAAAQPGIFTTIGHAVVLTHHDKKGFRLLDPSDNSTKNHSLTTFSSDQLTANLVHYWVITKE